MGFRSAALALLLAATGCTGGTPTATTTSPSANVRPSPSASPCPRGPVTKPAWPGELPDDLPKPHGAKISAIKRTQGDILLVDFTTGLSLREAVLFIVNEFPKVGYQLGRGDAEIAEADAPFQRGALRGLARVFLVGECKTRWVYAVGQDRAGVPFNYNYTRPPSASPLPFG